MVKLFGNFCPRLAGEVLVYNLWHLTMISHRVLYGNVLLRTKNTPTIPQLYHIPQNTTTTLLLGATMYYYVRFSPCYHLSAPLLTQYCSALHSASTIRLHTTTVLQCTHPHYELLVRTTNCYSVLDLLGAITYWNRTTPSYNSTTAYYRALPHTMSTTMRGACKSRCNYDINAWSCYIWYC